MARNPKTLKAKNILIRVTEAEDSRVRASVKRDKTSISDFCRAALAAYCVASEAGKTKIAEPKAPKAKTEPKKPKAKAKAEPEAKKAPAKK